MGEKHMHLVREGWRRAWQVLSLSAPITAEPLEAKRISTYGGP